MTNGVYGLRADDKGLLLNDSAMLVAADTQHIAGKDLTIERLQRENTELTALLALADERAKLHKEANDELAAHVERLREIIDIHMDGGDPEDYRVLGETPAKSLQTIKAEVEQEVIEWCKAEVAKYYGAVAGSIGPKAMDRKYI